MMTENVAYLPRIGIGEAAKLYGMTLRAIRYYEERGIVSARRDRANIRYYDGSARRKFEWISLLRNAGLGLSDIKQILAADEHGGRGRACALEKLRIRQRTLEIELALLELAQLQLTEGRSSEERRSRMAAHARELRLAPKTRNPRDA